jgi:hypothetical protein
MKNLETKVKKILKLKLYLIIALLLNTSTLAQQAYTNEEDMRDIFFTGGYGALFGATMGTALLPFLSDSPLNNLRVIAGGASIGFMMGSAYGIYNLSHAKRNSYFNYTPENDDTYFYSMPPFTPHQGKLPVKKNLVQKKTLPRTGALIVGEGPSFGLAFPAFWITRNQIEVMVAALKF